MTPALRRWFPFLGWFPLHRDNLRADVTAGITVALILVPQSMAYAALAGLPVVYGLYAAFVPVIVASLWGSSPQLHTGPVAMLSLMSAAALIPLAAVGTGEFIGLSLMLAMMVGVLRLLLGVLRLGVLVNFISHPVTVGFTNAAALIIGLSLLNKILNVPMPRTESFLHDLWVTISQIDQAHAPTLVFAVSAALLIWTLQRRWPRLPAILVAVVLATTASWLIGFEQNVSTTPDRISDPALRNLVSEFVRDKAAIQEATREISLRSSAARQADILPNHEAEARALEVEAEVAPLRLRVKQLTEKVNEQRVILHRHELARLETPGGVMFVPSESLSEDQRRTAVSWRFVGVRDGAVSLSAGGDVVGRIPAGLPSFSAPPIRWELIFPLLPSALVMALIGFMEATSISKAVAARTRQRLDTNQELIGQGLANIVGSFFQSYVVSGSFSRSAVAARTGARTGLFAIISALGVVLVMLFLTPALYHLPQAVLAVIVMMAVFGLVRIDPLRHAWRVQRSDAIAGMITFVSTLVLAPSLASGIGIGVGITVALFLIRNLRPRAEILGRHPDGTLGGIKSHNLKPLSEHFVAVRFDGSLNFINIAYFEDIVLEALSRYPRTRAVLVIGSGINDIDATGEEKVRELSERLRQNGVELVLSSLKKQVQDICTRSGLCAIVGDENIFKTKELAIDTLHRRFGDRRSAYASS